MDSVKCVEETNSRQSASKGESGMRAWRVLESVPSWAGTSNGELGKERRGMRLSTPFDGYMK